MDSPFQKGIRAGTPGAGVTITRSWVMSSTRQLDVPSRNVSPTRDDTISVTFADYLDRSTAAVMEFDVAVFPDRSAVPGRVEFDYSGKQARFIPAAPLSGHTLHVCSITTGVYLVAGQLRRTSHTWAFVTGDSGAIATTPARGRPGAGR